MPSAPDAARLRSARVGELLSPNAVVRLHARRLESTALLVPGRGSVDRYLASLKNRKGDFAAWDGNVQAIEPDGDVPHRLTIIDRYGQVYAVTDAIDAGDLPDADALEDWFRFLATACPECGVLDDPIGRGWTP